MTDILETGSMEYRLTKIPEDLWHRFKVLCVLEKTSIRQKLLELVIEELKKNPPPKK